MSSRLSLILGIAMFCAYGVYAFYFLGLPMLIKQFWPAIKNLYSSYF